MKWYTSLGVMWAVQRFIDSAFRFFKTKDTHTTYIHIYYWKTHFQQRKEVLEILKWIVYGGDAKFQTCQVLRVLLLWVSCERFSVSSIQLSDSLRQKIHALHTYIQIYYWKTHFQQRKEEEEKRWRLIVAWNRSNDVWLERSYVLLFTRVLHYFSTERERERDFRDVSQWFEILYLFRYKMYCSSQSLHQSIRYLQLLLS
jgi:hypothetical protein